MLICYARPKEYALIAAATRRLEETAFTGVNIDRRVKETMFLFDDLRLVVSPADYLEDVTERDTYWIFFTPEGNLSVGPAGAHFEQDRENSSIVDRKREERPQPASAVRANQA